MSVKDKGYREETIYVCEHCGDYDMVYVSEEEIEKHVDACIFNPKNKSYATSKFLGIKVYPPTNKRVQEGQSKWSYQVGKLVNSIHVPFDTRDGRELTDEDFYKPVEGWEEADKDNDGNYKQAEIEYTQEMLDSQYYKSIEEAKQKIEKVAEGKTKEVS